LLVFRLVPTPEGGEVEILVAEEKRGGKIVRTYSGSRRRRPVDKNPIDLVRERQKEKERERERENKP